jgi:hypothetical protein
MPPTPPKKGYKVTIMNQHSLTGGKTLAVPHSMFSLIDLGNAVCLTAISVAMITADVLGVLNLQPSARFLKLAAGGILMLVILLFAKILWMVLVKTFDGLSSEAFGLRDEKDALPEKRWWKKRILGLPAFGTAVLLIGVIVPKLLTVPGSVAPTVIHMVAFGIVLVLSLIAVSEGVKPRSAS